MRYSKVIASVFFALSFSSAIGESYGVVGKTYPIAEENALTMIMNKLKGKEKSGELARLQKEAVRRSLNSVKNMPAVDGLTIVKERSKRLIDPTVYYPNEVRTDEGQVVVPAGARINPLEIMRMTKTLVFFDGRDVEQNEAVRRMVQKDKNVKPILIAGSWLDLTKSWKTQVFFDQKGTLSKRFGLRAVPAVIKQEGKMLLLEEVPAKDLK